MSQEQLEVESGVPQPTISVIERGLANFHIGVHRALRLLCSTLGISILEAYHLAGLLDTADEAVQDAIEIALIASRLTTAARRELLAAAEAAERQKR